MIQPSIDCPAPQPPVQGIIRVAVDDAAAQLIVTFQSPITPSQGYLLDPRSYSLTGGQRLFPRILSVSAQGSPPVPAKAVLQLDQAGDFSVYTLSVSRRDIDPFFASHKLRFRVGCDDSFDCRPAVPPSQAAPEIPVPIDYLAKDYASFRQALLDFIPTRLPAWTERSEADIGMMLVELFAATADNLSYMQDRVANEAFLDSATQRRSVAQHLALIGYTMDPGASAAAWLQMQVRSPQSLTASSLFRVSSQPRRSDELPIVFETLGSARLFPEHNAISLFAWGNADCCLPRTATGAVLAGSFPNLRQGDYLLFENQVQRDIVRLVAPPEITAVSTSPPAMVTQVRWSAATPLRFDYCVSGTVVRGNLVLATHGETVAGEPLRVLTPEQKAVLAAEIAARGSWKGPRRQRLRLARAPLAYIDPATQALVDEWRTSATPDILSPTASPAAAISLAVEGFDTPWRPKNSLLDSGPSDADFRVELDDLGDATVVFGDGTFGAAPAESASVFATYRVGGGSVGNVAADTLIVPGTAQPWLISVTNPLPAFGGRNLESRDHAKRFGPPSFRKSLVAVTTTDYQDAAESFRDAANQEPIQRSNADFRWTGSWLTVTLSVDPKDGVALDPTVRQALLDFLDTRRLTGYDLDLTSPVYVPLEVILQFCVSPGFIAADVQQSVEAAFSASVLPDQSKGFFHPDNFTFGQSVFISRIYQRAMEIHGVESVDILRLARLRSARPETETAVNLKRGYLEIGRNQIARLDNDRNFPENGTLVVRPVGVFQ